MEINTLKDLITNGSIGVAGTTATITLSQINEVLAMIVALSTIVYMVTMIVRNIKNM